MAGTQHLQPVSVSNGPAAQVVEALLAAVQQCVTVIGEQQGVIAGVTAALQVWPVCFMGASQCTGEKETCAAA